MIHIDWPSFIFGIVAAVMFYQVGCSVDKFCERMIDFYQRRIDERDGK